MNPEQNEIGVAESKRPFYQRTWFYVAIALVILLTAGVIVFFQLDKHDQADIQSQLLFDMTYDEWLANLNQHYKEMNAPTINRRDVIDEGDGIYTIHPNPYVVYSCLCPEDRRIYMALMTWGGDGTEYGAIALMSGIDGYLSALHPEYTFDDKSNIIDDLMNLNAAQDAFVRTSISVDDTYYIFEVKKVIIYLTASSHYLER